MNLEGCTELARGRRPHVKRPGVWTNREFSEETVQVPVVGWWLGEVGDERG